MKLICIFLLFSFFVLPLASCSQNKKKTNNKTHQHLIQVGGGCEGCEAIYESPIPFKQLSHIDTLPDYFQSGPKLYISGIIYKADGKTPAPDVVMYVYHTDQHGLYSGGENEKGWGKRHGSIRGWIKTNEKGEYRFVTLKPASYPGTTIPAHIHPTIKEDCCTEYYIDDYLFDDDVFLTKKERAKLTERGGNGILKPQLSNGVYYAVRNIILGLHIPNYPE